MYGDPKKLTSKDLVDEGYQGSTSISQSLACLSSRDDLPSAVAKLSLGSATTSASYQRLPSSQPGDLKQDTSEKPPKHPRIIILKEFHKESVKDEASFTRRCKVIRSPSKLKITVTIDDYKRDEINEFPLKSFKSKSDSDLPARAQQADGTLISSEPTFEGKYGGNEASGNSKSDFVWLKTKGFCIHKSLSEELRSVVVTIMILNDKILLKTLADGKSISIDYADFNWFEPLKEVVTPLNSPGQVSVRSLKEDYILDFNYPGGASLSAFIENLNQAFTSFYNRLFKLPVQDLSITKDENNGKPAEGSDALNDLYQLQGFAGSGGISTVYYCTKKDALVLNRKIPVYVAKIVKTDSKAYKNELAVLRQIKENPHESLVNLENLFAHKGDGKISWYAVLILETVHCADLDNVKLSLKPRQDLFTVIETFPSGKLPMYKILDGLKQIVDGLLWLKDICGVAHGDVKDENIIVNWEDDTKWKWKIIDFGSCLPVGQTDCSKYLGTYHFSSPELVEGNLKRLASAKSSDIYYYDPLMQDAWCLGLLLFTCCFGDEPFTSPLENIEQKWNATLERDQTSRLLVRFKSECGVLPEDLLCPDVEKI
ncbi:hypothetical protein MP638_000133 [Amoeboaphelidium occidentale]|nr:hypothetical protein MP638_000133 [Amoeboaphelidium occidentale]